MTMFQRSYRTACFKTWSDHMAKMNNLLASFVIACASLAAAGPFFSEPEHGDMLRTSFDLSEARHDWNSERWWIECLFVDLDGDGVEEMASSTVSQSDRSGSAWSFWRMESGAFCRLCARNGVVFGCHPRSYYKLCVGNGLYRVVLLGITAGALDGKRMMKPESMFADASVELAPDGDVDVKRLPTAFDEVFAGDTVCGIERLYGESYSGFDFKPAKREYWFNFRSPKGDLRPGGGIVKPDGFDAFAARLRREVAGRLDVSLESIRFFSVFLDADNDGDADAYVAFATDRTKGGKFRWTLYLNNGGGYSKAEASVFPVPARKELCGLAPSVVAHTNGICRVIRFDVEPTFLILDGKGSPTKVRDAITNVLTHRIEKLPCVEIDEE